MPNIEKIQVVDRLVEKFDNSAGIYFTRYTGLDVVQATELRKQFRENGVDYFVSKNTLTKIAANKAGYEDKLDEFLIGQVGIAYASEDPTSAAKVIKEFKKNHKASLEVLGLVFEGEIYSANKYEQLAELPSREVLLSTLLSGLSMPMGNFLGTINGAMSKFVNVLNSLKENKS